MTYNQIMETAGQESDVDNPENWRSVDGITKDQNGRTRHPGEATGYWRRKEAERSIREYNEKDPRFMGRDGAEQFLREQLEKEKNRSTVAPRPPAQAQVVKPDLFDRLWASFEKRAPWLAKETGRFLDAFDRFIRGR